MVMQISVVRQKHLQQHENLVYLISEEDAVDLGRIDFEDDVDKAVQQTIKDGDFTGAKDTVFILKRDDMPKRLILSGLGAQAEAQEEHIRRAACNVVKKLQELKVTSMTVLAPEIHNVKGQEIVRAIIEGAILGDYEFSKYKTEKKTNIQSLTLIYTKQDHLERVVGEIKAICENVLAIRNLVNENSDAKTPEILAKLAVDMAKKTKLNVHVLDEKELRKLGMHLILAVSQGSRYPPKMIILEYNGNKKDKKRYALVGKGITFDSGGLNLKTGQSGIETMKMDMAGAATVLGVMKTLALLKVKRNVVGVIPCCENMISATATKPGAIIQSYAGKTVEIVNTDAEGRLVLADALAYTEKTFAPACIIDLATLTGAILRTFGEHVAGMMTTSPTYGAKLFAAGQRTYERVWELPLYKDYEDEMKSDFADVPNYGYLGRLAPYAGSIMGAIFLRYFVEKTPWIHVDIAGTAWAEKTRYYTYHGGTGFGVRLLMDFFEHL